MQPFTKRPGAWLTLAGLALGLLSSGAVAESVEDFYRGKNISLYIGYSPGGGYDTYGRTVARHMGRHIPGKPRIVVKNRPGAGSMLLTNELYNTLPKDGTVIATVGRGLMMEPLFGTKEAKYKPAEFGWLGSANNEVSVCVSWHKTDIKTFEDLFTKSMIVGGTGPGADTDTFPKVLNNVLGTKLKLVTGYPGGNDILFAMERGEVEGRCGYSWSSAKSRRADWLKDGKMRVLVQMSTAKHPDLPDVPFVMDFAKSERDKEVLGLIFARQAAGRPFLAPPGVPSARLAALRAAFEATMADPKFLEDAKRQKLEVAPVSGEKINALIAEIYAAPADIVAAARDAAEKTDKTEIAKVEIPIETVEGMIASVKDGGRKLSIKGGGKTLKLRVSGSRTKVMIGGQKAKRDKLAADMNCKINYKGSEATEIDC